VRGNKFISETEELILFIREIFVMKMKKMYLRHLNLKNFMIIQKLKKIKDNSIKFLELYIMNLKML